jgi:hypothetical protein
VSQCVGGWVSDVCDANGVNGVGGVRGQSSKLDSAKGPVN